MFVRKLLQKITSNIFVNKCSDFTKIINFGIK